MHVHNQIFPFKNVLGGGVATTLYNYLIIALKFLILHFFDWSLNLALVFCQKGSGQPVTNLPPNLPYCVYFTVATPNDCKCLVSTYSHIKKLWENKDKQKYNEGHSVQHVTLPQSTVGGHSLYPSFVDREVACSRHSTASSGL